MRVGQFATTLRSGHWRNHANQAKKTKSEMQELRRQRTCQKRRQESPVSEMRRDRLQVVIRQTLLARNQRFAGMLEKLAGESCQ